MALILAVIGIYLLIVIFIGLVSRGFLSRTGEDYFVATRSMGPFVLFMSLFGTNMTAFAILGSSGQTYREGIGVFGLMASASALVIPCVLFFTGTRLWAIGKRHGYVTQVQYFRDRWESNGLGTLLFFILVFFSAPYILTGVMGGGTTLTQLTSATYQPQPGSPAKFVQKTSGMREQLEASLPVWALDAVTQKYADPQGKQTEDGAWIGKPPAKRGGLHGWVGGLIICVVVCIYTFLGGMRGANWAQTFQAMLLLVFGAVGFIAITNNARIGGFAHALDTLQADPEKAKLLARDHVAPLRFWSYTLIPLSVGMFPHMFIHLLTSKKLGNFRYTFVFYPICIGLVWLPSVLLGLVAAGVFPGLSQAETIGVLLRLYRTYAPDLVTGLFGAGVFAAVMGSLDSHILCLGSMFTQDVVDHYGLIGQMNDSKKVFVARSFVVLLLGAVFLAAQFTDQRTIFGTGTWCFSAFSALFPILLAALFWKRSTKAGIIASALSVAILIPLFYCLANYGQEEKYTVTNWEQLSQHLYNLFTTGRNTKTSAEGVLPVAVILPVAALLLVVVSLVTRRPTQATLEQFFPSRSSASTTAESVDAHAGPVPTPVKT
ncbi:MAG TPA: sodium:solute symporter family protein [Gemmataceae bacterium]|nr:sodium:solute symporter family protein [Gemmataceae bacterium]